MKTFKSMCKTSKYILKGGYFLVIAAIFVAVFFYAGAGRIGNYYYYMSIFNDLIKGIHQTIGIIMLSSIAVQLFHHKQHNDIRN